MERDIVPYWHQTTPACLVVSMVHFGTSSKAFTQHVTRVTNVPAVARFKNGELIGAEEARLLKPWNWEVFASTLLGRAHHFIMSLLWTLLTPVGCLTTQMALS